MKYNQLEKFNEINIDLETYEDTIHHLQHKIGIEKQKHKIDQSILGRLRFQLNKARDRYFEMYLMKYEVYDSFY